MSYEERTGQPNAATATAAIFDNIALPCDICISSHYIHISIKQYLFVTHIMCVKPVRLSDKSYYSYLYINSFL